MIYQNWEKQEDIVRAVNLCLKAIQESGISADRAAYVPGCLTDAVRCGNDMMLKTETFRAYEIECKSNGKGERIVSPAGLTDFTTHDTTACCGLRSLKDI